MIIRIIVVALALTLASCKHPIEIIGHGDVLSASGNRDCLLEDFQAGNKNCSENDVSSRYEETYFAVPRKGWQFGGWVTYCAKGTPADQCSFSISKENIEDAAWEQAPPLGAYFRREVTAGHKALMMGHSFFDPIANIFPGYAASAGFGGHTQDDFFSGGDGGAPIAFWSDTGSRNNIGIKQVLDQGAITLFGMTLYPHEDRDYDLQGYKNWIDYALQSSDNFTVFIGMPWLTHPAALSAKQYKKDWLEMEAAEIHDFIDQLRAAYPNLEFYCIPYGMGPVELKKMFDAGQLPEFEHLVSTGSGSYIFSDDLGHGSDIINRVSALIWLKAIYGVDLDEYSYNHPYSVDLKALATRIMNQHDHHYDPQ
jgi:hypothetical protein